METRNFETFVFPTRREMGENAAAQAEACINALLAQQACVNIIFAAAPSQNEFLEALAASKTIDFSRVNAFHMDEYVGLPEDAPQRFGNFLNRALFSRVAFRSVHYLDGNAPAQEACAAYSALLRAHPADIVCMGIGENGHIAFNDPPVADLHDPALVKPVELDEVCRQQQVNDGCFAALEDVPTHALTLTIPALCTARHHFCMVPGPTKAQAVYDTIYGAIGTQCPATALRLCGDVSLFLDAESASLLEFYDV